MAHYAIVVDLDRCIGCHGCEIACKNENEVELGSFWNKVVQVGPFGDYPHLHQYFLPVMCQQCDDSPCTHVCPTGASYRDGEQRRAGRQGESASVQVLHDGLPVRRAFMEPVGTRVEKCTLCGQLTSVGEEPSAWRRAVRRLASTAIWTIRIRTPPKRLPPQARLGSSPEGRGQRPSDGLHPVSQVR